MESEFDIRQDLPQNARTYLLPDLRYALKLTGMFLFLELIKSEEIIVLKRCYETNGDPKVLDCA